MPFGTMDVLKDLGKGKTITSRVANLIQVDTADNWTNPTQVNHDVYCLWVLDQLGKAPTGDHVLLRLEPNTKGLTVDAAIAIPVGGVPAGDIAALFALNPDNRLAWATGGGALGGAANGFLRIKIGATYRYIQLYAPP